MPPMCSDLGEPRSQGNERRGIPELLELLEILTDIQKQARIRANKKKRNGMKAALSVYKIDGRWKARSQLISEWKEADVAENK